MRRFGGPTTAWLALPALAALVTGALLAAHHPLWPQAALALFGLWFVVSAWRPACWLLVLPATLPLANLSPWTGWIVFEEFDLIVLGAIAGGYLRWAVDRAPRDVALPPAAPLPRLHSLSVFLALALGALGLVGLYRGLADAGFAFGWFHGYADALNSLRIFKPLAYALLLWPLLQRHLQACTARTTTLFGIGVLAGLAVVSLAVVWERMAFPGLWEFSETYRVTALFWEMHVGGAAIDAYLALTMPFVAWALWSARSPARWAAAATLALVACYACLMTFSRGVYLAVAVPMLLLGLLLLARRLSFRARAWLRRALAYAALGALTAAVLFIALQAFGAAGVVGVSLLLLVAMAAFKTRLANWRGAAGMGLVLALLLEVVAVFGAGNFMASRLLATERDFGSRLAHWGNGLSLLHTPAEWMWGIGLGRLPASYARFVPEREFSGTLRWVEGPQRHQALRLHGPKTQSGLGGLFAVTQRLPLQPATAYTLAFDARVLEPAILLASVCEMHLLYDARCQGTQFRLQPGSAAWQHHERVLRGPPLPALEWPAPRLRVFALTLAQAGTELEVDNLRLIGDTPANLLDNGDFSQQMAHWWPAAQFHFLPWHIDNLYLELLIERGLGGSVVFVALVAMALWNVLIGPGRGVPVAPFLAASLCGVSIIGLVSSVLDVPRVALLFLLLVFLVLSLRESHPAPAALR